MLQDKSWIDLLENLGNSLNPVENVIAYPQKFYGSFLTKTSKITAKIEDYLVELGHLQLIRRQIAYRLSLSANFDSKMLHSALKTFNQLRKNFTSLQIH